MKSYNEVLLKSSFELEELDKTVAKTEKMLEQQKQKIESLVSNIEWLKANFQMVDSAEKPEGEFIEHGAVLLRKCDELSAQAKFFRIKNSEIEELKSNKFYELQKVLGSSCFRDETGQLVDFTVMIILLAVSNIEVEFFEVAGELPFDLSKDEVTKNVHH